MLSANITIKDVDYEETMKAVFPFLKKIVADMETPHMSIRLFQKLDDAALPIALDIMNRVPTKTKTEIMVTVLNTYSVMIREKLNEELANHPFVKYLKIGKVSVVEKEDALFLHISKASVDYDGLVKENLPVGLGFFAAHLKGERLEKMAMDLLWTEDNKKRILSLAQNVIDKYGLRMTLTDLELMQDQSEEKVADETDAKLHLTEENEEDILNALAEYLKTTVKE